MGWETGAGLHKLDGQENGVSSLAFSPDGAILAGGNWSTAVTLWDAHSGHLLRTLEGTNLAITSIAFSPDGSLIAAGSDDTILRLWNADTGKLVRTWAGNLGGVNSIAFSPAGDIIASGRKRQHGSPVGCGSGALQRVLDGHTER